MTTSSQSAELEQLVASQGPVRERRPPTEASAQGGVTRKPAGTFGAAVWVWEPEGLTGTRAARRLVAGTGVRKAGPRAQTGAPGARVCTACVWPPQNTVSFKSVRCLRREGQGPRSGSAMPSAPQTCLVLGSLHQSASAELNGHGSWGSHGLRAGQAAEGPLAARPATYVRGSLSL